MTILLYGLDTYRSRQKLNEIIENYKKVRKSGLNLRFFDGKELDFPDDASWNKWGPATKLSRDDWRRQNVDTFIARVYQSVKAAKPWVKFGVSPFGIWRPGYPPQIKGLDAYANLYADSRKWLQNGWVDYFTPQLYWRIDPPEQSFPVLLKWWATQNLKHRHLWPGMNTGGGRGDWKADEITRQIEITRKQPAVTGHVHWNMKSLIRNRALADSLAKGLYAQPALVPAIRGKLPGRPHLSVSAGDKPDSVRVNWSPAAGGTVRFWVLQTKRGVSWTSKVTSDTSQILDGPAPEVISVTAIDHTGNASPPVVLARQ